MTTPDPGGPGDERLIIGPAEAAEAGTRLDAWLAARHPHMSRARWQELIKAGRVTLGGLIRKPGYSVAVGDQAEAIIPPPVPVDLIPEAIALNILHEDADMIVLNKPPGIVVHPAPGHASGTLVNALLHHCSDLAGIGGEKRPGIVHRLDRDTSGVLVVAKNGEAMLQLARQFKDRETRKEYAALVWGTPAPAVGTIRAPIGRDPVHRQKMSVRSPHGRDAVTHYQTIRAVGPLALLTLRIETGRTHQIRVHLAHIRHPVVGDPVYGLKRPPLLTMPVARQMLHAWRLTLRHPRHGQTMTFEAPWPNDFRALTEPGAR